MRHLPTATTAVVETLELRRMLAVSAYAHLVGQDTAAADYPNINGTGVTVAVIDTGVDYTLPALGGGFGRGKKVIGGYDFFDNDSDPIDTDGHGTKVASVIAANPYTTGGITYSGVAPAAKIVALRVGTEQSISDVNIEKALRWVINVNRTGTFNISVVNLSLGAGNYPDPESEDYFSDELATLKKSGVFVVAASGNSNDQQSGPISEDGLAYPAADPSVFAVSAVDANDVIAPWAQRGDELDLLAPGVRVVLPRIDGGYSAVDGTSFSSPYVAGTAALIKQVDPLAGAGDVGSALMASGAINRDGDNELGNTTSLLFSRLNIHDAIATAGRRVGRTQTLELGRSFDTALDSGGVLHAAFYDTRQGRLLYATRNTHGFWSAAYIVDDSADVGVQASIAVDRAGHVGIGYFDITNTAVKYASINSNLRWSTRFIDSDKHVGSFPSLGYDIDGNAYLAYYRRSGGSLRMATLDRDTNTWTVATIDGGVSETGVTADVGQNASLAVGEAAISDTFFTNYDTTVAIAYADATNGDLKYARLDLDDPAATWYVSVVDNGRSIGSIDLQLHPSFNSDGLAAQIGYIDAYNGLVKYAYRDDTWFTESVADVGRSGGSAQLWFDADNDPLVTYFNGRDRAIYTSTRDSRARWSATRISPASGLVAVAANDRSQDLLTTWLDRARQRVYTV